MATDYDAPRRTEEFTESIEALRESVPDSLSGNVDVEEGDELAFDLPGADLSDADLEVVVLPPQDNEFTCTVCFLVKHCLQLGSKSPAGPICQDCQS